MIRRRNFNIVSLVAGRTEKKGITRMTLVLNEPDKTKQKQATWLARRPKSNRREAGALALVAS